MRFIPCSQCTELVAEYEIKYHTADGTAIFCGAECSLKYYQQRKENEGSVDREI